METEQTKISLAIEKTLYEKIRNIAKYEGLSTEELIVGILDKFTAFADLAMDQEKSLIRTYYEMLSQKKLEILDE